MTSDEFIELVGDLQDGLKRLLYIDLAHRWLLRTGHMVKAAPVDELGVMLDEFREWHSGMEWGDRPTPSLKPLQEERSFYLGRMGGKGLVRKNKSEVIKPQLMVEVLDLIRLSIKETMPCPEVFYNKVCSCTQKALAVLKDGPKRRLSRNDRDWLKDRITCFSELLRFTTRFWQIYESDGVMPYTPYECDWNLI